MMITNAPPPASLASELTSIKVVCRLRQQNQLEMREHAVQCTTVVGGRTMYLRNERCEVDEIRCTFDRVFDIYTKQEEVYTHTAKPLVQEFLQGYNCTIFAYGQTGSGKTHTILGPKDGVSVGAEEEGGIISRVAKDLYEEVERAKTDPIELSVSFVEIYMEQIRDLLSPSSGSGNVGTFSSGGLKIRESAQCGVYIEEMTRIRSKSEAAMMELVKSGTLSRAASSTRMNKDSSRSHTILMVSCVRKSGRRATMYIVDLAGSELVNKTNASGRVLQEAKAINKSLSALSNVIKALGEGKRHVPYRDSKLTRLLQDSLGGTAKTCLILAASCSSYNMAETISTLRFGLRAKEIKNPVVQRTETGLGAAFTTNILFKELYQRAMEDMEAKNRTIDELQRLLASTLQESLQPDEALSELSMAPTQEGGTYQDTYVSDADDSGKEGDDDKEDSDEDENDLAQIDAQKFTELELTNQALKEENERLFGVLGTLEKKLDEVVVDTSTGRPILTLSSQRGDATEGIETSWEAAAPSLRMWLDSDNWRKTFDFHAEAQCENVVQSLAQPFDSEKCSDASAVKSTHATPTLEICKAANAVFPMENETSMLLSGLPHIQETAPPCFILDCVHHANAEALSRQLVELKLLVHYMSENARLSLSSENYSIVIENARLKTRIEEQEYQANVCNVACSQLEMKNRACETRLSNQETHINCLQNSLQEYQGLFKQQVIMSQEKCRLLTDELEFYKKLARCSQESYQHLSGGLSPSRRKSKSPSPKKNASAISYSTTPNDQKLSLVAHDSAAAGDSQVKASSIWPSFGSLSRNGSSSSDFTSSPLAARSQSCIVKPIGQSASRTTKQTLLTEPRSQKTSANDLSLSLDDLARPATAPAPAITFPFSL